MNVINKITSSWAWERGSLFQYDWCPYKGGKLETDTHRIGPCEDKGTDWVDAFIS